MTTTGETIPGPLAEYCSYCGADAGEPCEKDVSWAPSPRPPARKPHAVRVRAAGRAAAHGAGGSSS